MLTRNCNCCSSRSFFLSSCRRMQPLSIAEVFISPLKTSHAAAMVIVSAMSALTMAVLLMPLSWPFLLSFSCRLATWMYRLFLVSLAALLLSATCLSPRQHDAVPDLYRYAVPPELDSDLLENDQLPGAGSAESQAFVFRTTEHLSVADVTSRLKKCV
ncbi:uncharacterized protein LOC144143034 [Haemaphysalis longicornis]